MEFKYIKDSRVDEDNVFIIKWRLLLTCNYSCPNCIQSSSKSHTPAINLEQKGKDIDVYILSRLPDNIRIKIELVGGEVSLLDLIRILDCIRDKKLWRIQITTNFSRHPQYYIDLANYLKSRNIELSLTASYHETQTSLDTFILKAEQVKNHCTLFAVEMVSTESNQELVKEFKELCELKALKYSIDGDKTEAGKDINVSSNKPPRYTVKFEDDSIVSYANRSNMLRDSRIISKDYKYIKSINRYCSYGYHYIYIDPEGFLHYPGCTDKLEDLSVYKPLTKTRKCSFTHCSLCGRQSLYNKEVDFEAVKS